MSDKFDKVFFSDAPPLRGGGIGMSVLADRLISVLSGVNDIVLSRRESRSVRLADVGVSDPLRIFISWDCAFFRIRVPASYRSSFDRFLLMIWIRSSNGRKFSRIARGRHIVALSGAGIGFLHRLTYLAKYLNCTYSLYVVDDYEESLILSGNSPDLVEARSVVRRTLLGARAVWGISAGMVEILRAKYQISAKVLYPISDKASVALVKSSEFVPFRLVYVGSINDLYIDAIHETMRVLTALSEGGGSWVLHFVTRDKKIFNREFLRYGKRVSISHGSDREQLRLHVSSAECLLLPYSFSERMKIMVETSFPSKFMDGISSGRPVIAFGPRYSSIIRHLIDSNTGYVATDSSRLLQLLRTRPWIDSNDWFYDYVRIRDIYHSPESARLSFHANLNEN